MPPTSPAALPPVRRSVTVRWSQADAFQRFTRDIGAWWPRRSHSIGGPDSESVSMEERVGGRIVERYAGGRETTWGTVTHWDAPRRVTFTWHPGHSPETAGEVDVTFHAVAEGTRVELVHTGWERLGDKAAAARRAYNMGWPFVLAFYAERATTPGMLAMRALTRLLVAVARRTQRAKAAA